MDPHSGNLARRMDGSDLGGKAGDIVLFDFGASEDCPESSFPSSGCIVGVVASMSSGALAGMIPVLGDSNV